MHLQGKKSRSLKDFLLADNNWYNYSQYYTEFGTIPEHVTDNITKVLSCKKFVRGHAEYHCSNKGCTHTKRQPFSCKSRICSSCGKMATAKWIEQQKAILPHCQYQHVTLTMPDVFWPIFEVNTALRSKLCAAGADIFTSLAGKKNTIPGMFLALHTYGRNLKSNIHLHVSVTRGGLKKNDHSWQKLYYQATAVRKMWQYRVTKILRRAFNEGTLILPADYDPNTFNQLLDKQYLRKWRIHCAKPHKNPKKDIEYLGRYLKKPPIANSRLIHYSSNDVLFSYHDHKKNKKAFFICTPFDFIDRVIKHIPPKGFRLIRYYGFLSNRLRGKLLPIVNRIFKHNITAFNVTWKSLAKKTLGIDPMACVLCDSKMLFAGIAVGLSTFKLREHHNTLALGKPIRSVAG